jgi:uncharacterized protein (TIGR02996 family)
MAERLAKLSVTIGNLPPWPALEPKERARVETLRDAAPETAPSSGAVTLETQLAHVYAHPEDDEARLVLGDLLQERGDVRGELITLQHHNASGAGTRETSKREKEILKNHRDEILGPLAGLVKKRDLEIHLGFVRTCEKKIRDADVRTQLERTVTQGVGEGTATAFET